MKLQANWERRKRHALDESYHYYKKLESHEDVPQLFSLVKCLQNVRAAIEKPQDEFRLTRQLWSRVYYALFDKLITSFPGYCLVVDGEGQQINAGGEFPETGILEFHPQNLKRDDDVFYIEIKHLYPATLNALKAAWKNNGAMTNPDDFIHADCGPNGCYLKPLLLGDDVLGIESQAGKDVAYQAWWELYWQAYCTRDEKKQLMLFDRMHELEAVWGDLYC